MPALDLGIDDSGGGPLRATADCVCGCLRLGATSSCCEAAARYCADSS